MLVTPPRLDRRVGREGGWGGGVGEEGQGWVRRVRGGGGRLALSSSAQNLSVNEWENAFTKKKKKRRPRPASTSCVSRSELTLPWSCHFSLVVTFQKFPIHNLCFSLFFFLFFFFVVVPLPPPPSPFFILRLLCYVSLPASRLTVDRGRRAWGWRPRTTPRWGTWGCCCRRRTGSVFGGLTGPCT